jgi:hypothetical protein
LEDEMGNPGKSLPEERDVGAQAQGAATEYFSEIDSQSFFTFLLHRNAFYREQTANEC